MRTSLKQLYSVHGLWVIMISLTLITYASSRLGLSGPTVVMFLLLTAMIKGWIIISDFMEVRGVALLWRVIMYGWLWLVVMTIAIFYLIGASK